MIKKILYVGFFSCFTIQMQGVVALGDTVDALTTFQFSVGNGIYDAAQQQLWTLTGQDISNPDDFSLHVQSYGIAYTPFIPVDGSGSTKLQAYPYITNQAIITTTDQDGHVMTPEPIADNPLLGKAFDGVTFIGVAPTVFTQNAPQNIYLIQSVQFYDNALGTISPNGSSIINKLDLGENNQAKYIAGSGTTALFIAQAQGVFGTDPSALSFATTSTSSIPINGQNTNCTIMALQGQTPISLETPTLTANTRNLSAIGTSVYMFPLSILNMYIGLDVTSNNNPNSCAVGLCLAQAHTASGSGEDLIPASIDFLPIIADDVVNAGYKTPISTAEQNSRVAVLNVTTTTTSTGLSYFISSRYDGVNSQSIYAMPMVTMATNTNDNNIVADFNEIKQTFKMIGTTYREQGFSRPIIDASQIDINSQDQQVRQRLLVGNGPVPLTSNNTIEQLVAQGDAVYITIQEQFSMGNTPGMFKSQALFDTQGRIMAWTSWQRVAGSDDQMLFAIKNRINDATMYVSGATSQTIQQTTWSTTGDLQDFIAKIPATLPKNRSGVQGNFPFSPTTPGLTDLPNSQVSFVVLTGKNIALIAQTGFLDTNTQTFQILAQTAQTSITLDENQGLSIGSIVACEFGNDGAGQNWLFMGADQGLMVIASADGSGFMTLPNNNAAQALIDNKQCKTLGNFKYIKKIICDYNYLYVMTQDTVYQILIDQLKFDDNRTMPLNPVVIASANQLAPYAYCLDMIIDQGLIVLGTTAGLFSIDLINQNQVQSIPVPGGLPALSCIQNISNGALFNKKSNMYILSIDFVYEQARLHRFTIANRTITPIQDQLLPGQNGPLLIFDYMNNTIFIDGSLGFTTSYRIGSRPPVVKYLQYVLQAGKSSTQTLLASATTDISIAAIINSLGITSMNRDYASGCLMLAGDFGLLADS